jgi:hypothetical protein
MKENLDLKLTPYKVLATSSSHGKCSNERGQHSWSCCKRIVIVSILVGRDAGMLYRNGDVISKSHSSYSLPLQPYTYAMCVCCVHAFACSVRAMCVFCACPLCMFCVSCAYSVRVLRCAYSVRVLRVLCILCACSACPVHTLCVFCVSCAYSVRVLRVCSACPVHALCMFFVYVLRVLCMFFAHSVCVVWYVFSAYVLCAYCRCSESYSFLCYYFQVLFSLSNPMQWQKS